MDKKMEKDHQMLQAKAMEIAKMAYVPYSKFAVGAALLCADGTIVTGCNVENLSFGATNCAERTALFTAITQGFRQFKAIAIYSPQAEDYLAPCGICRQVLSEFVEPDFVLYLGNKKGEFAQTTFKELLPRQFDEKFM